jgi:predicted ribosome quality control (RQC) complex YloA/Tae2 family protein
MYPVNLVSAWRSACGRHAERYRKGFILELSPDGIFADTGRTGENKDEAPGPGARHRAARDLRGANGSLMIHESAPDSSMSIDLSRQRPTLDALCLTAVRKELEQTILGGAIQRVEVRPNELSLEVYAHRARRRLFCHVGDDATRVHLASQKEPSAVVESPMLLQLRKHVRGGRIVRISQPRLERLLQFEITTKDDGEIRTCGLIIETMGRRSNAILVNDGDLILDALRRTPPSRSPNRPVLPSLPYQMPPPQDRLDPADADLATKLADGARGLAPETPASEVLAKLLAGFSPAAAREVVFRATGAIETCIGRLPSWDEVALSALNLVESIDTDRCDPYVASFDDVPISVTPYRPHFLESIHELRLAPFDSMSAAVEAAFAAGTSQARVSVTRSAADVARTIRSAIEIEQRRAGALAREVPRKEEIEQLRLYGEAIFASLATIPKGATSLEFNGLTVPLDPPRKPVEVANDYFGDYAKRRDAAARVPVLQETSAHRLEYLESLLAMAEASEAQSVHRQIARELEVFRNGPSHASTGKRRRAQQEPQPRRFQSADGLTILVGTNGTMNERVTFKLAAPDDIWFHARGEPGAHVILRTAARQPSSAATQLAANLAARFSRARANGSVTVDHTAVRNVRKIRGAPPGLVRYVNEQTITGYPDQVDEA